MRTVGRISGGGGQNKVEKLQQATRLYLEKSRLLSQKLVFEKDNFPVNGEADLLKHYALEYYLRLLVKHIDLLDRRILQGEIIPHPEKMMSVFETCTEWVVKGKSRPSIELGKKLSLTSDQFDLILYHKVMDNEQDRDIVIETADTLLTKYKLIDSMSFDKGHWDGDNKARLELEIPNVILPKLGKCSVKEKETEQGPKFKYLKNKHSAIESNINELEHRGLNRCPDRSYFHFKTYIALGVCAYNLKKIGKKILANQLKEILLKQAA
jgi:hypothetical protein